jgi:hypothetical protein
MLVTTNYPVLTCEVAITAVAESVLYFDRRSTTPVVPETLRDYVTGDHHLFLKQIPSALTLRKASGRLDDASRKVLLEDGFSIFRKVRDLDLKTEDSDSTGISMSDDIDALLSEGNEETDPAVPDLPDSKYSYEDPFRVFAGWVYSHQFETENPPQIYVWPGGCNRIQSPLNPRLCGIEGIKGSLYWNTMKDVNGRLYLLQNHTHWGDLIRRSRFGCGNLSKCFAETLWRRIKFFLRGKPDPIWTKDETKEFLVEPELHRNPASRAVRFLEVLKTVDGMFLQRFLSFPEEKWDWNKFDLFICQGISYLIGDEFLDGEVTQAALSHKPFYSDLKAGRKAFKLIIHQDEPQQHLSTLKAPRWVESFFTATWKHAAGLKGFQRTFVAGILSQTRGAGTPPPTVVLLSKVKFLTTTSQRPEDLTPTEIALIDAALDSSMRNIPTEVFTGLDTKARVTVTGSACWEETRREGGTAQAILSLMSKYDDDHHIPVRDLEDGTVTSYRRKEDFESIGTAIFFACLQEVLDTEPEDLGEVYLTLVKEPGKARSVTKGHAALKIVLDTVSKVCAYPLRKGFKSSESGMGRSHHGWNFFKDMCSEEMVEELFHEDRSRRTEVQYADYVERHMVWEDIFAGSTDYQEATDKMVHGFADLTASKWMTVCGIPPLLQGIVRGICFRPRRVYFTGTGVLADIGVPSSREGGLRVILLQQGVLMGDPLTKVVLHFSNIIARELGSSITDGTLFKRFTNGDECYSAYRDIITENGRNQATPRG